jgi:PAS domain S-box-containing protein
VPVVAADPLQTALGIEQLFVTARDALVVADIGTGLIVRWNRAAERMFEYSTAAAVGRPVEMLMPLAVARLHRERVAHYARTGDDEILTGRTALGIPVLTSTGNELRVELSMQPLEIGGAPTGAILLTFRDASCEKRAELSALQAMRAEVAQADSETRLRRCEVLLRETTRDLEEPVARARRAAARLARLAGESDVEPRRLALLAHVIEGRTDDLRRRLEQIVDAAAIEAGAFELNVERVNLVPLVARLVGLTRARTTAHRLSFAAPQGLTAQCDARYIESVIMDLIDRAIRRNPRGCWIDVDLRRPLAGVAQIEVRDYGRGASARERARLGNYATADRGWFVNRHIIEQHGGTLSVEYPPEGGVRVVLSLPTHRTRVPAQSSAVGGPA